MNVPAPDARIALLNATIDHEAKMHAVTEACRECGHHHPPEAAHHGHVIDVDFGEN